MNIFGLLTMLGGLALFLYGMSVMGDGLASASGGKLELLLERLTAKKWRAVLLGTLVTAVIQSSSATTVMVVGFVNSGIMKLEQAVGIIMGANVGTTVTSWLLSMAGISGDSFFVQLLKPSTFSPVLALIGIVIYMTAKGDNKKKNIGNIMLGFAILMFGMETMSDAVKPLAGNESFCSILTRFSNPLLGMLAGAALTAVIQSSSASVGILQALCISGAVTFGTALPIIMGQNIGTCVTAILSSVGANKNAKRASIIHLYFNLLGTIAFMVVFYGWNMISPFAFLDKSATAVDVAVIHSVFNIACAVFMYPLSGLLVKLSILSVPEKGEEALPDRQLPPELAILDERFLNQPGFACELSMEAAKIIAASTRECMILALELLNSYSEEKAARVRQIEDTIDSYEDVLGTYLVKLSGKPLSQTDSRNLSVIFHCISDFERISDHAVNICNSIDEMRMQNQGFSEKATNDLMILEDAVRDIVSRSCDAFIRNDLDAAKLVEPLEEVIDGLNMKLRQRHINRLRAGKCTIELGIVLEDVISNLERVSDHCSNIAVCMIQVSSGEFDMHEYVEDKVKHTDWFYEEVRKYSQIYALNHAADIKNTHSDKKKHKDDKKKSKKKRKD